MKITLAYGLPGSGKSTKLASLVKQEDVSRGYKQVFFTEDENFQFEYSGVVSKEKYFVYEGQHRSQDQIIDFLFKNPTEIRDFLEKIPKATQLEIYCFEMDVEASIHNDKGRRSVDSIATIKKMAKDYRVLTKEDFSWFKGTVKIHVLPTVRKTLTCLDRKDLQYGIIHKGISKTFLDDFNKRKFYIEELNDDNDGTEKFDEFVESFWPTITFLNYKKLKKECYKVVSHHYSDYYEESRDVYFGVVDVEKLETMINKLKDENAVQ